jgi:hypothetical protein
LRRRRQRQADEVRRATGRPAGDRGRARASPARHVWLLDRELDLDHGGQPPPAPARLRRPRREPAAGPGPVRRRAL